MNPNYVLVKLASNHQSRLREFNRLVSSYAKLHCLDPFEFRFLEFPTVEFSKVMYDFIDPHIKNKYRSSLNGIISFSPEIQGAAGIITEFGANDSNKLLHTLYKNGAKHIGVIDFPTKGQINPYRNRISFHREFLSDCVSDVYTFFHSHRE